MKRILLTSAISYFASCMLFAQYCGTARYDTEIFSAVTTTSNVPYGQNLNINNAMQTLNMDIYQPTGDVAAQRPVIIFAHGGSFIGGAKTDADQVALCTRFAKRGYIAVTIDYRIGMGFPINQASAQKAVWRATQDMKAAVRFFRKDAATTNTYKADPNYIFVGGYSAGAFMGVQYAYLDQSSEVPAAIDTTTLGGLEGNSGNPGYPSAINAVLNLAGAVGDTAWMKSGDEPMVTVQGNNDATVPYCTAMIFVSGFQIMVVSGGGTMHIRCFNTGIENPIHTFYGQGHTADVSPAINLDTSITIVSNFVYKHLGCTPSGNPNNYINNQTCVMGVTAMHAEERPAGVVSIYPNPSSGAFTVQSTAFTMQDIELYNVMGEKIISRNIHPALETLNVDLPAGIYSMKIISNKNEVVVTKLLILDK